MSHSFQATIELPLANVFALWNNPDNYAYLMGKVDETRLEIPTRPGQLKLLCSKRGSDKSWTCVVTISQLKHEVSWYAKDAPLGNHQVNLIFRGTDGKTVIQGTVSADNERIAPIVGKSLQKDLNTFEDKALDGSLKMLGGAKEPPEAWNDNEVESRFFEHAKRWHQKTAHESLASLRGADSDLLAIHAMGMRAVPLLLLELAKGSTQWLWSLKAIVGDGPVAGTSTRKEAVRAWLAWGKERGYLR